MFPGLLSLLLALPAADAPASRPFFLKDGQRVVFLGDSNTYAGHFIGYLDGYLLTRYPTWKVELINLGLPSETVSGLSEPDHPYPRPDIHERLERALAKTRPDVVVVCYGMNDGIYHPFSEERFKKYQEGLQKLVDRVHKDGAKVVLMTPAPFDPLPLKGKVLPKTADRFSWMKPYERYDDEVLARYSEWLLTWRDEGFLVADPHTAIRQSLTAARKVKPEYVVSGDGIHPNTIGHALIARELLSTWQAREEPEVVIDGKTLRDEMRFSLDRPPPVEPFKRLTLVVRSLPAGNYALFEGDTRLAEVTGEALDRGIDLLGLTKLSLNRRATEISRLTAERQKVLGPAWLTDVGHKRPDTPKGVPLEEARKKAAELEEMARKLAVPMKAELRLEKLD